MVATVDYFRSRSPRAKRHAAWSYNLGLFIFSSPLELLYFRLFKSCNLFSILYVPQYTCVPTVYVQSQCLLHDALSWSQWIPRPILVNMKNRGGRPFTPRKFERAPDELSRYNHQV